MVKKNGHVINLLKIYILWSSVLIEKLRFLPSQLNI